MITRRTRKDGSLVDVELLTAPVLIGGERVGYSVIYHDIGEIQRQRRYYEALVQANPVAIVLMDPDGIVTSWNPAAERLFDYAADEAIGRHIDDLVAAADEVRAEGAAYTERGMTGETRARHHQADRARTGRSSTWRCSGRPSSWPASPSGSTACTTTSASSSRRGATPRRPPRPRARSWPP